MRTNLPAGILLPVLLATAFMLACRLTVAHVNPAEESPDDALDLLLGGSRVFLGGLAMDRADFYLHRGHTGSDTTAFSNRWFQRVTAVLSPTKLEHREGTEGMQELLPWITLAARATPTNTDYVLTQIFLLRVTGNPQQALAEIRRLRTRQPQNPDLYMEEARIRLAQSQWDRARATLDTCTNLLGPHPSPEQTPLLAEACMWRGLLWERSGSNQAAAVACLTQAAQLEPAMYGDLTNRVRALQAGQPPALPIAKVFDKYQRMATNPLCTHHHGEDAHEPDDHEQTTGAP
jgi:hypothetical protein